MWTNDNLIVYRRQRHDNQHRVYITGQYSLVQIIVVLGLLNTRYSNSFSCIRYHDVPVWMHSGNTRHNDVLDQGNWRIPSLCSATLTDFETPLPKQTPEMEVTMQQDINVWTNDVTVDCNIYSSSNSTFKSDGVVAVAGWMERLRQLHEFKLIHGHVRVPKRYKGNPSLANWVSKQRQQYHNYQMGKKPCSLSKERIHLLNQLNFCWNATSTGSIHRHGDVIGQHTAVDVEWWSHYEELYNNCQEDDDLHKIIRQTRLGAWLNRQRKIYDSRKNSARSNSNNKSAVHFDEHQCLTDDQLTALARISDVWWMTRREWQWEMRYRELQQFTSQCGHCCVPISYSENKHLAHWVSNQRKLYNLRMAGKRSELTPSRIQQLEAIGFVWNRWDYEFSKKTSI